VLSIQYVFTGRVDGTRETGSVDRALQIAVSRTSGYWTTRGLPTRGLDDSRTGRLADATGDFACLVFVLLAACETASCPVRDLSSYRTSHISAVTSRYSSTIYQPVGSLRSGDQNLLSTGMLGHVLFPNNCPFAWGIWDPSNTCFLGPTRVHNPNDISIGSAVFAQITAECRYTLQRAAPSSPFKSSMPTGIMAPI